MAQAFTGTSGFDYLEWKPGFYPGDLPRKRFLSYYASRFRAVELNNTFYRIPNSARIAAWSAATPDGFAFSLKAPRRITHFERLKTPSSALDQFIKVAAELGPRLGALLFQLPPYLKCDGERLSLLLASVPLGLPIAFEFRHESWFRGDVYRTLERAGAALCIHDADEGTTPEVITSHFAYVRLRRSGYTAELRREWLEKIRKWTGGGTDVYVFIKHEDNPDAPLIATAFDEELAV